MDLSKLKPGDWATGIGGIVLFIASFLPWFGISEFGGSATASGWDVGFFWAGIPALLGLALAALVAIQRFTDVELPDVGTLTWGQVTLIAAVVAAVPVILKLLLGESVAFFGSLDRQWGIFVATIAAIAVVVGGFLRMQEDKAEATGGSTPPPPPPSV